MLIEPCGIDRGSISESDASPPLPGDMNHSSEPPVVLSSDRKALQRLVSRTVPQDELLSVMEAIAPNMGAADVAEFPQGNDA